MLLGARSLSGAIGRLAIMLLPVVLVAAFVKAPTEEEVWSKNEKETVSALLSHTQRGTLKPANEDSLQIRLEIWTQLLTQTIPSRPLGAGLGAGSLGEARFARGDELPPIDNSILVMAVACGIPGALLFVWLLARATWLSLWMARRTRNDKSAVNSDHLLTIPRLLSTCIRSHHPPSRQDCDGGDDGDDGAGCSHPFLHSSKPTLAFGHKSWRDERDLERGMKCRWKKVDRFL